MKIRNLLKGSIALLLLCTVVYAEMIEGRGASFPNPLYKAWSAAYFNATRKRVGYIATDSGDGISSLEKKIVDFGASDIPLTPEMLEEKKLFVFPSVVGAIAIVYNLEKVKDGELKLSRKALDAIFSGKAKFWDDPSIAKENSALQLPHAPIRVVVRSDASGTTYNFINFLHRINPKFKVSRQPQWTVPDRIEAVSNSDVWIKMHETKNTIGYIEYAYKKRLDMSAAKVENSSGKFISPNVVSIQKALKYAGWTEENYYYKTIVDPQGEASYPLVAATFLFISQERNSAGRELISFLDWVYRNGDAKAVELGYVPLPSSLKKHSREFWKSSYLDQED